VPNELFDQTTPENGTKLGELMRQMVIDRGDRTNETINVTDSLSSYLFETRDENHGILQVRTSNTPTRGVQVRYKLVGETPGGPDSIVVEARRSSHQALAGRWDAASAIQSPQEGDRSLAAIALDAARAGDFDIARRSVQRINSFSAREKATTEAARQFAKRGQWNGAVELGITMGNSMNRDRSLSELAAGAARAGDGVSVKLALRHIENTQVRDETAHGAAGSLAKNGQRGFAVEVARSITQSAIRDRALSELAQ
jgi:hypothetical protein